MGIAPQYVPAPQQTNVNVRNKVWVASMAGGPFTTGSNTLNVKVSLKKPSAAEYSSPLTFTVTSISRRKRALDRDSRTCPGAVATPQPLGQTTLMTRVLLTQTFMAVLLVVAGLE